MRAAAGEEVRASAASTSACPSGNTSKNPGSNICKVTACERARHGAQVGAELRMRIETRQRPVHPCVSPFCCMPASTPGSGPADLTPFAITPARPSRPGTRCTATSMTSSDASASASPGSMRVLASASSSALSVAPHGKRLAVDEYVLAAIEHQRFERQAPLRAWRSASPKRPTVSGLGRRR